MSSASTTATHDQTPPESGTLAVPDHCTTKQIGLRTANPSVLGFGLGIFGMTLLLLAI